MLIKAIGCIFVIVATSLMGLDIYKKIAAKKKFTEGVMGGLSYLKKEISFSLTFLGEGLLRSAEYAQEAGPLFSGTGQALKTEGGNTYDAWKKQLDELQKKGFVDERVYGILDQLGRQLGKNSLDNEINTLDGTLEKLEQCLEIQQQECEQKGKLYRKAGVLAGLVIVILLV